MRCMGPELWGDRFHRFENLYRKVEGAMGLRPGGCKNRAGMASPTLQTHVEC